MPAPSDFRRFDGRVSLVTGAASGIGRATAERLFTEGAKVVAWDINANGLMSLAEAAGDKVMTQRVDVTNAQDIEHSLHDALERFGKLQIVVNAAGIVGPNGPFWQVSQDDWEQVFRVNLLSTFLVSKAATPHLMTSGWGRIVNVASVTASEGPRHLGVYAASKAGLIGLTKSMGKDLAGTGTLVNAVAPALIATDLLRQLSADYHEAALSRIPLGRPGTLEEAAALITWLCSDECSFSTGAVFDLSGGRGH